MTTTIISLFKLRNSITIKSNLLLNRIKIKTFHNKSLLKSSQKLLIGNQTVSRTSNSNEISIQNLNNENINFIIENLLLLSQLLIA